MSDAEGEAFLAHPDVVALLAEEVRWQKRATEQV
jgi:hypothetical protein